MLEIKITGIDEAIKAIQKFTDTLEDKMKILIERLMDEGYSIASAGYAKAVFAGTNDVIVEPPSWEGNILTLRASGETVAFIEFGTGVTYPEQYPRADVYSTLGMSARGSYGKGKGSQKAWVFYGEPGNEGEVVGTNKAGEQKIKTHGNPPARAMFDASQVFADQAKVNQIAREVFR